MVFVRIIKDGDFRVSAGSLGEREVRAAVGERDIQHAIAGDIGAAACAAVNGLGDLNHVPFSIAQVVKDVASRCVPVPLFPFPDIIYRVVASSTRG